MRRSFSLAIAAAALLALQAQPASAKGGDKARRADNKRAFEAMDHAFGCMMNRNPGRVRAYLAAVPGSDRESVIGAYLYRQLGECLVRVTSVRFNDKMARGVAAERVLAVDFAGAGPLQLPVRAEEFGPLSGAMTLQPEIASGYAFARCVVIADPAGTRRILDTPRGSAAELAAMRRLRPHFPGCVIAGATFSIDRWTLRPFLAEALYQVYRARNPAAGAAEARSSRLSTSDGSHEDA